MGMKYQFDADREVLIVHISGTYIISNDSSVVEDIIGKLQEHKCSRILLDYRNAKFVVETLPAYDRPRLLEDLGVERSTKFASVYREFTEDTHYTESVYRNRGWRMKDFLDFDAAMDWLTST